jgi:hypothetical protein
MFSCGYWFLESSATRADCPADVYDWTPTAVVDRLRWSFVDPACPPIDYVQWLHDMNVARAHANPGVLWLRNRVILLV